MLQKTKSVDGEKREKMRFLGKNSSGGLCFKMPAQRKFWITTSEVARQRPRLLRGEIFLFVLAIFLFLPEKVFAQVVINEFQVKSDQWIELYNKSENSMDISGWIIDDDGGAEKYIIFSGIILPSKRCVSFQSGKFNWNTTSGDTVRLLDSNSNSKEEYTYSSAPGEGISIGRVVDGEGDLVVLLSSSRDKFNTTGESCLAPPPTLTPTPTPTPTNTSEAISAPTPTPTSTPVSSSISGSFSSPQTVGEEFDISVTLSNFEAGKEYYLKARIGPSDSELAKGETYGGGSWYSDTAAWSNFPKITTNASGGYSGSIKAKLKSEQNSGNYKLRVRARKVDSETNYDSSAYDITFNSASSSSPTSTPTLTLTPTTSKSPTPTPTPTRTPTPKLSGSPTPKEAVLGEEETSESGQFRLTGGLTEGENVQLPGQEKKKLALPFKIKWSIVLPLLAAIAGVGFVSFSVISFLKSRKHQTMV